MGPTRPTARDVGWAVLIAIATFRSMDALWDNTPIAVAITIAAVTIQLLWPAQELNDDDPCTKCDHLRIHHQGPCQACLRAVQNREEDARPVPCGRFSTKPRPANHASAA